MKTLTAKQTKTIIWVLLAVAVVALSMMMTSCTDATMSKVGGYGDTFTVKVLGPDTVITYHSTGKVISEERSDGYYFTNAATGKNWLR